MAHEKLETEVRQEQIVEAAMGLIAAYGVRRVSMAALARRVGLVPSALYRHFKNKEEILQAALQLERRRMAENLKEVCALTPNALERLEQLLRRVIKMVRELQAMPRIIFSEGMSSDHPERKAQAYEILKGLLGEIENIMRQGQERGEIRSDLDPRALAVMFWGMIPSAVILWHVSDGRFDVTRQAEKTWELFREAVRAR
jgi:TetR/AcrR family transcriptional regulator, fatty acid metabolism regulator protein